MISTSLTGNMEKPVVVVVVVVFSFCYLYCCLYDRRATKDLRFGASTPDVLKGGLREEWLSEIYGFKPQQSHPGSSGRVRVLVQQPFSDDVHS